MGRPPKITNLISDPGMEKLVKEELEEGILNMASDRARRRALQARVLEGRKNAKESHEPFCEACMFTDFNQALKDLEVGRDKDSSFKIPDLNWKEYLGLSRFKVVGSKTSRKRDGNRIEIVEIKDFKCVRRGHGVSVAGQPKYEVL